MNFLINFFSFYFGEKIVKQSHFMMMITAGGREWGLWGLVTQWIDEVKYRYHNFCWRMLTVDGFMSKLFAKDLLNFHNFPLNFRVFLDIFLLAKFAKFLRKEPFHDFLGKNFLGDFRQKFFLPFQYSNSIIVIFKWNPAEEFCSRTKFHREKEDYGFY